MKFWERVNQCRGHEPADDSLRLLTCSNAPHCPGTVEWRCKHCGVYIIEDQCGELTGVSGWAYSRRLTFEQRKAHKARK